MAATTWRGRIAFGMVAIPVRLQKAARRERIRFHHVYQPAETPSPDDTMDDDTGFAEEEPPQPTRRATSPPPPTPIRRPEPSPPATTAETGPSDGPPAVVERFHNAPLRPPGGAPILKGYEVQKDQYVVLDPQEIAALRPRTSTELAIVEFVLLKEIDPLFFDTSYYVLPERGGEKPYAILFETLRQSGYVALGSVAMHGREHAVVIRPGPRGLILHTLYYANEVRSAEEYSTDPKLAGAKEVDLAKLLVQALAAEFEPAKLKDTFEERLRALIDTRAATSVASDPHAGEPAKAPAVDIMEALRKSIERARKPVASETSIKPPGKTPVRRRAK
jgi:DNA end-binding protein Ku